MLEYRPREALQNSAGPLVTSKSGRSCTQQMFQLSINNGEIVNRYVIPTTNSVGSLTETLELVSPGVDD